MKRFAKIAALLALTFLILLIIASFILKLYFPAEKVKAFVVSEATKAIGRDISIGDVNLSIFKGIDIRDIYIGENKSIGVMPFIKVKRVAVGYSLSEIFHKRIVFNRVSIEGPEVYIRSRKGRLAYSDLIKRPPPEEKAAKPLPVTVVLQRGEVKGLNLFYEAEDAKVAVKGINVVIEGDVYPLEDIDIRVSSEDKDNISVSAKGLTVKSGLLTDLRLGLKGAENFFAAGTLTMKEVKAGIKNKNLLPFDAAVGIDLSGSLNGSAEIKKLSLTVGKGSNVNVSGSVKNLKGFSGLQIESNGESELSEVSRIVSKLLPLPVSGSLKIGSTQVTGNDLKSLSLKTQLFLKGVAVSHKGITLPLEGHINAEANSKGDVILSSLKITSGSAARIEASAKASGWGKGRVDGKAKVSVDNARALDMMPKDLLKKIGKVDLSGETTIEASGRMDSDKRPLRVKVAGKAVINNLQTEQLSVQRLAATFSASSEDLIRGRAVMDAGLDVSGIEVKKGEIVLREDSLKGAVSASGDLKKGDIALKRFEVLIPELLKIALDGDIKGWGHDLAINAKVVDMDYKKMMERLPSYLRQRLPKMEVEGKGALSASISGGILPGKKGAMERLSGSENPLNITGTFKTKGLAVFIPDKGIKLKDSEGNIEFDISPTVQWVAGAMKVGSLEKEGLLESPIDASVEFEALADGTDLNVKNISVRVPPKAASVSISGDIKDYIKAPQPRMNVAFSFNSSKKISLVKGIGASGAVSFKGSVKSEGDKELALKGSLKLDHLAASYMDRGEVKELNGEISISQGVRYAKGVELMTGSGEKGAEMPYAASLSGLLRPYVKKGYDLTMGSLSFDGYEAGPLSMDIAWDNGNLKVDRYDLALFGGDITGRMQAAYTKGVPEYSLFSNIAGIRFDKFFKDKKGGEEMEVNADLNLKGRGTEIEGEVNVTKIGKDILDRGLLRIDPNESNPQIVDIRSKLNTLGWVPKEVSLWIRHGELNMDITLQRKEVTMLNIVGLEKIPVRRVPVGYLIKKGLKRED